MSRNQILGLVLLIFLSFLLMNTVSAINEFDSFKPYLHNPSVGDVPELRTFGNYKTELFPGAATYNYDLEVSPGVTGLQPSLSLFYNSQTVLQSPDVVGAGWSLSEKE